MEPVESPRAEVLAEDSEKATELWHRRLPYRPVMAPDSDPERELATVAGIRSAQVPCKSCPLRPRSAEVAEAGPELAAGA